MPKVFREAPVAQMVERKTLNLVVVGSSPTGGGIIAILFFVFVFEYGAAALAEIFSFSSRLRHLGREVKAADSKSAGLCPRRFESCRCRVFF